MLSRSHARIFKRIIIGLQYFSTQQQNVRTLRVKLVNSMIQQTVVIEGTLSYEENHVFYAALTLVTFST